MLIREPEHGNQAKEKQKRNVHISIEGQDRGVAIRDVDSKRLGSAGQQIEVPDLKKNELHLSGLTINEVEFKDGKPRMSLIDKAENGFAVVAAVLSPVIRRFRPGATPG